MRIENSSQLVINVVKGHNLIKQFVLLPDINYGRFFFGCDFENVDFILDESPLITDKQFKIVYNTFTNKWNIYNVIEAFKIKIKKSNPTNEIALNHNCFTELDNNDKIILDELEFECTLREMDCWNFEECRRKLSDNYEHSINFPNNLNYNCICNECKEAYLQNNSIFLELQKLNQNNDIKNYAIIRTIGTGANGPVYKGVYIPQNKLVAIKIKRFNNPFEIDDAEHKKWFRRMNREIYIHKQIKHNNILLLENVFYDDDKTLCCFIYEYINGYNLNVFKDNCIKLKGQSSFR